ncbi:unnamed protein product, partial [Staurois parvus]
MGPLCPRPTLNPHPKKPLKGTRGISWGPLLTPGPRAVPEFPNGQSAPVLSLHMQFKPRLITYGAARQIFRADTQQQHHPHRCEPSLKDRPINSKTLGSVKSMNTFFYQI